MLVLVDRKQREEADKNLEKDIDLGETITVLLKIELTKFGPNFLSVETQKMGLL